MSNGASSNTFNSENRGSSTFMEVDSELASAQNPASNTPNSANQQSVVSDTADGTSEKQGKQPTSFVVSGSRTNKMFSRSRPNILLESGISKNKSQRKALGAVDVRYQLKTLESASVMDSDDFFAGDFSKQIKQNMLIKPQPQSSTYSVSSRPNHGVSASEEDTEMTTEDEKEMFRNKVPKTYFNQMCLPSFNVNYILDSEKELLYTKSKAGKRLKKNAGLTG